MIVNLTLTALPNSPKIPVEVSEDDSPTVLRERVSKATKIPLEQLKLIYRGRLIVAASSNTNAAADTKKAVAEFKLEEACVLHCIGKPSHEQPTTTTTTTTPAAASTTTTTASTSSDPLESALALLKSSNPHENYTTGITTLEKILTNISEHPMEEKYRRMKQSNPAFTKRLGGLVGAKQCMAAVGFTDDPHESLYVMHPSPDAWPKMMAAKERISKAVMEAKGITAPNSNSMSAPLPAAAAAAVPPAAGLPLPPGMPPMTPQMQQMVQQMMSDPNQISAMLSNPMVQNMMRTDPRLANNPMMQQQMQQLASNPQALQQITQMMQNPQMAQAMMNMVPGGSAGLQQQQQQQQQPGQSDQDMTEDEMLQEAIRRSMQEQ